MNKLQGKKVIFLGDSITEGIGASSVDTCYVNVFKKISGATVLNYGIGGTRIAPQEVIAKHGPEIWNDDFIKRAKRMEDNADYVVVFGGTNDFAHGDAKLGKFKDTTDKTFYGALHVLFTYLYNKYPTSKIIMISPTHRQHENRKRDEVGKRCKPLSRYVQAIREECEKFSIPLLDLYKNSNFITDVECVKNLYLPDGLHPSDLGHEKIAKLLYSFIVSNYL